MNELSLGGLGLLVEFLEKTYSELNENIKFSEAKNAVLITLNTAVIGASSALVFNSDIAIIWRVLIVFFAIGLMVPLSISLYSFIAKMHHKNDNAEDKKFMYFSSIYKTYYKQDEQNKNNKQNKSYYDALKENCKDDFVEKQLSKQIVDLSAVAYKKFKAFNIAVIIEICIFMICSIFAFIIAICKLIGVL